MIRCRPVDTRFRIAVVTAACGVLSSVATLPGHAAASDSFADLTKAWNTNVRPLVTKFCLDCHSTEAKEGELDLQRYATLADLRRDPAPWQRVVEMLDHGEMPPEDSPQLSADQKRQLRDWAQRYLDTEALANAGDPGPVVLRRLNNSEYTYTVRDLTGVESLDPAHDFPVDGAAGEGFTNTGNALSMSPALVQKYLDAGKEIARHAVLTPEGIRFIAGTTRRDAVNDLVRHIRGLYLRYTSGNADVSQLDHWSVSDPRVSTLADGRVDLSRCFAALLQHRAELNSVSDRTAAVAQIAEESQLNTKYLGLIAETLFGDKPESMLLGDLRRRFHTVGIDDAGKLAADVRAWQDQLWKFNTVGHFGSIRPWQEAVTPLRDTVDVRLPLKDAAVSNTGGEEIVTLYLIASSAGSESEQDVVEWVNPRLEQAGRPATPLRDVRAVAVVLQQMRDAELRRTADYLAVAFDAKQVGADADVEQLATKHGVDADVLRAWLNLLGIAAAGDVQIPDYLHQRLEQTGGYPFVKGWGLPGADALSIVANSSDQKVNIPGDLPGHTVAVHPRPERWVAVGWKSPLASRVRVEPTVADAHNACGNGIRWSVELRRGSQRRVLRSGDVNLGSRATIEPIRELDVRPGDLLSLIIDSRDRNHVCDLTHIDLSITELRSDQAEPRRWSLSGDCADSIAEGNPLADRLGNPAVWHFYTGLVDEPRLQSVIPENSLPAKWLDTSDSAAAAEIAKSLTTLLTQPLPAELDAGDALLWEELRSLSGPLFGNLDRSKLAGRATAEQLAASTLGVDPNVFSVQNESGSANIVVRAPSVIAVRLPRNLLAEASFVTTGRLHASAGADASVQLAVTTELTDDSLLAGVPLTVRRGGPAESQATAAFDEFRGLFPTAMCHARIVPVDEVVTLVLFHREDDHLGRLMLSDAERAELDRLWEELRFVSQDALTMVTGFEQLMEFATQDADPRVFEPLRKPIADRAAAFRQTLLDAEPRHVDALVEFANRAYRHPLTKSEVARIRSLYRRLRNEEVPHDEAARLTLARILTSPAFLFRTEKPGSGSERVPVNDHELATRLSYFLSSTLPDGELRRLADAGQLSDPDTLVKQMRLMLDSPHARRLAIEFACQWLHVRDFDQHNEKSEQRFPEFASLRSDMYEESIRFFADLFRHDRSILQILDADHTFLNERLAAAYGVPDVAGPQWRLVEGTRAFNRGGILTQASILSKQSGASRTSPILRGNWLSEVVLGERLPRPPKNVPVLPEDVPAGLSERQLIERHSSDPACAKCHQRIDPFGFALERFDAIGRLRERDASGQPVDTKTTLPDGTQLDGLAGLQHYLLTKRREDFLRQFCRKLLGYALGRSVQLSDEPLLAEMRQQLKQNDFRFQTAVETIVRSQQFRMIRGAAYGTTVSRQ
ncbi:DUF1592 domain-containing protein [bacterium]|nr:DUF1592 domain-containing protein [bacterium]